MTPENIQKVFSLLQYDQDNRNFPEERRRGQFRAGWQDATHRNKKYAKGTLQRLTWRNLGFRLGRHFGEQTVQEVDGVFDLLAHSYESPATDASVPSTEQYVAAFQNLRGVSDTQIQMLRSNYHAPARTISAKQLADAIGYDHYPTANLQYGRLARLVGNALAFNPTKVRLATLVMFARRNDEWHWIMRPQVAAALELLGWVNGAEVLLPEEIAATVELKEGAAYRVSVNAYERNPEARRRCIEAYGASCCICGFNFVTAYGNIAEGFIHVHHLKALADIGTEYVVDPLKDLRPVCPNCHAVLHRRIPAFSIDEVREMLRFPPPFATQSPSNRADGLTALPILV